MAHEDCAACGEPITGNIKKDREGEPYCEDCYRECHQFQCSGCLGYSDDDDMMNMVGIIDSRAFEVVDSDRGLVPGLFKINAIPYTRTVFRDSSVYRWVIPSAVERIGPLPEPFFRMVGGCSYGYLCEDCQIAAKQRLTA